MYHDIGFDALQTLVSTIYSFIKYSLLVWITRLDPFYETIQNCMYKKLLFLLNNYLFLIKGYGQCMKSYTILSLLEQ